VAQAAETADCFRPAAPPKSLGRHDGNNNNRDGNKKKDVDVKQRIPIIEDYLRIAADVDYIRLASSYLEGGARSLWTSVYEAYKDAHARAEPPNP
jgi:hypothetical protein